MFFFFLRYPRIHAVLRHRVWTASYVIYFTTDLIFILKVNGNYFLSAYTGKQYEHFFSWFFPPKTYKTIRASDPGPFFKCSLYVALVVYFPQTAFSPYLAGPMGLLKYHERFEPRQAWIPATDLLLPFMHVNNSVFALNAVIFADLNSQKNAFADKKCGFVFFFL